MADKIDFQNFANIFTEAYDMLDVKEVESYYHKKYFSLMPERNARLLCSAGISDVFGGMGSWDDGVPYCAYEKGLTDEYDKLSKELSEQIELATMYALNEW